MVESYTTETVERGTHEELLAADGLYVTLWQVQVGEAGALPEAFLDRAAGRSAGPGRLD